MPVSPLRKQKFSSMRFHPCLPGKPALNTKNSRLNILPDELLILIIEKLPNMDLLNLRSVNKHIGYISQEILRNRTIKRVKNLSISFNSAQNAYEEMLNIKKPQLDYFMQFLNQVTMTQLNEISRYNSVGIELQIVLECLVTLKSGPLNSTNQYQKWTEIKRSLNSFGFKNWVLNLKSNVESLDLLNVQIVKEIIINHPSITYERIREISVSGFNILVFVAACLQLSGLSHDLHTYGSELKNLENQLTRSINFLKLL